MQTRHGCFAFDRLRLRDRQKQEVRLMSSSVSQPLRRVLLFWANRLSFGDVARLTEQMTGQKLLSEDAVWRLVQREARQLDAVQHQHIQDSQFLPEPTYVAPVEDALYEPTAVEFIMMTDGILVKSQKPTRESEGEPRLAKERKWHETDVLILPRRDGSEEIICDGVSGQWTLIEAAQGFLRREWTGACLSVVALTDGAQSIRCDLLALFGQGVRIVLDWYHLAHRVYQKLSMAAHSRQEREVWERYVLSLLWRGKAKEAQVFLSGQTARNVRAMTDLIGYLDKHAAEIIDYERRQKVGKPIGSGRMEKCVDQVVGHRQKGKGMSWTLEGSRTLALLKAEELNAHRQTV